MKVRLGYRNIIASKMDPLRHNSYILYWSHLTYFVIPCVLIHVAVKFNFSTESLVISEGGDLSQVLFINKTGDNTETISFRVTVINGTANQTG